MTENRNRQIQSVDRAFTVLDALKRLDGAGVTTLHEVLGLAISTTRAYLATLEENGLVIKRDGEYHVALSALEYGGYARENLDFFQYARKSMVELADETGELVAVSIEEHGQNVYLGYETGRKAVTIDIQLGSRLPLHCLASGKAILASLPPERTQDIIETQGPESITENTITDEAELFEELETIRDRDIAFDDEERIEGMRAVAAPVSSELMDDVYGAIVVSGPKNRIREDRFRGELPSLVRDTAKEVSINLAYS